MGDFINKWIKTSMVRELITDEYFVAMRIHGTPIRSKALISMLILFDEAAFIFWSNLYKYQL
jgi:hypothetical protein